MSNELRRRPFEVLQGRTQRPEEIKSRPIRGVIPVHDIKIVTAAASLANVIPIFPNLSGLNGKTEYILPTIGVKVESLTRFQDIVRKIRQAVEIRDRLMMQGPASLEEEGFVITPAMDARARPHLYLVSSEEKDTGGDEEKSLTGSLPYYDAPIVSAVASFSGVPTPSFDEPGTDGLMQYVISVAGIPERTRLLFQQSLELVEFELANRQKKISLEKSI